MKLIRLLLFPFSILYDVITSIRNWCFDVGFLKSTSFNIPVIAVGNLNVGGTGKTPQIEYLIRLLKDNHKIAVLSRGYKRKTKGFQIVTNSHTAEDVGDEPLQFFKKFKKITVAVDTDRTNGIKQLLKSEKPPKVVLLDDAFQHRKVKASFYILLTKFGDLFSNDFILPTGNLRESSRGVKRADCIIVTKCPTNLPLNKQNEIAKKLKINNKQKVFFTSIEYDDELQSETKKTPLNELKNKKVILVTGIANPKPLLDYLTEKKICFTHLKYPDHHNFSAKDITKINEVFNTVLSKEKIILTTEKDFVRLQNKLQNVFYITIKSQFLTNEDVFTSSIQDIVNK